MPFLWKRILKDFADEFGYHHLSNKFKESEACQEPLEVRQKDSIGWRHSFIDIEAAKKIAASLRYQRSVRKRESAKDLIAANWHYEMRSDSMS